MHLFYLEISTIWSELFDHSEFLNTEITKFVKQFEVTKIMFIEINKVLSDFICDFICILGKTTGFRS